MNFSDYLILMGLIFTRFSGLFALLPVFSSKNIPWQIKAAVLIFISMAVMPIVSLSTSVAITSFMDLAYHLVIEFIIGLSFGLVIELFLSSLYLAGGLLDRNIGFSMVNVISPTDQSSMPVSANLYYIFAMMIFLFTDGHHIVIQALIESLKTIPIGGDVINIIMVMDFTEIISQAFILGVRMAAPFIITIMVANIILGMLSKAMPGMNVFMIGMPFKIFVGLALFSLIMPAYYNTFIELYKLIYNYLYDMVYNYL
ncbi:MAG: flagellar biosynthetic protein FliR [Clostridia bacterium]|nr:flagellar biosynthetic protein FliR [Clostridia bacterium]